MTQSMRRILLLLLPLPGVLFLLGSQTTPAPTAPESAPAQAKPLPPPENLRLRAKGHSGTAAALLDPDAEAWKTAATATALLSHTPRLFQTDPLPARRALKLQVQALRAEGKLVVRMEWQDTTRNNPEMAAPRKDGANPPFDREPPSDAPVFADALAVMVPENWSGQAFPSLQMGDQSSPALLYYWNASRGAMVMAATGRATPQPSGKSFAHRARHEAGKWTVTAELPDRTDGYPVAFAVWDGETADRDGKKFFSVWHVLTRE